MRYPQTFVDDLKRQADIVRVVQDYVQLKKKGANWMACCPFHKEKTPSFSVSPTKEIFYCFGCHKGGDVFSFVKEIEGVGYGEAIKIVADRVGIPLPKMVDDDRFAVKRQEADEVVQLNNWALDWWEKQLETSAEARTARDYLEGREITDETKKTFRLGYSPDSWDALSSYLRQKGATQFQIERSGLLVKRDDGKTYDRFRGRLMFPVFDTQGRPIAFGGRTLKNEDAKYINSPETAAYIKGRNLYGLNLTRDEIRRNGFAILVEGFLDLIVPYQFGIRNVAASLGTALTSDQVKLLSRFAHKVVVNYDGDRAGVQAAKKSIEILLAEDIEVKVLVLPENADPDEFIRKFGASEYQQRRAKAQPHIQFVIENALRDRSLHRPAEKAEAVDEVLPYIRAVQSRIQKREYFDMAMDALQINDISLKRELWQSLRTPANVAGSAGQKVLRRTGTKPTVAEQRLLELLLANEQLRQEFLPLLGKSDYEELATASIFTALIELQAEGNDPDLDALSRKTGDDTSAQELLPMLLIGTIAPEDEKPEDVRLAVGKCLDALRLVNIDRRIRELSAEIAAAERNGEDDRRVELIMEYGELDRRRKSYEPQSQIAHAETN
ncbi:MAG TPA: DNA primase [Pyrinomonadaceae bacterium]|jgi:DNA primase, catalytic core|nr:DNA primase [Pyrinomonadaceae bacterium]